MPYKEEKGSDGTIRTVFEPVSVRGKRTEAMRQEEIKELLGIQPRSIEELSNITNLHYQTVRRTILTLHNSGEITVSRVQNKTNYYTLNSNKRMAIPRVKSRLENRVAPITNLTIQCGNEENGKTVEAIKQLPGMIAQLALLARATEVLGPELVSKEVVRVRQTLSQMQRMIGNTLDIIDQFATNHRSWDLELLQAWPFDEDFKEEEFHAAWLKSYRRKYLIDHQRSSILEELEEGS